jgi:hypothetical protein
VRQFELPPELISLTDELRFGRNGRILQIMRLYSEFTAHTLALCTRPHSQYEQETIQQHSSFVCSGHAVIAIAGRSPAGLIARDAPAGALDALTLDCIWLSGVA